MTWIQKLEANSKLKRVRHFIRQNGACEHNKYNSSNEHVCDNCKNIAFPKIPIFNS